MRVKLCQHPIDGVVQQCLVIDLLNIIALDVLIDFNESAQRVQ
ncbi:MAG: Uncharacterised protein [Gammaproteobacteria bacterium]|nr:MAG: Uncharacterised protein [Gammaproteobacteria bacterium]